MMVIKLYRYEAFQVIDFKILYYPKNRNIYIQFDIIYYCQTQVDAKIQLCEKFDKM